MTKNIFRVALVEWPDGLMPGSAQWLTIATKVRNAAPDILVTNEMPFGSWFPATVVFDAQAAAEAVSNHEKGIEALHDLGLPLVLSSRPVQAGDRLANEAFALAEGQYRYLHQKHYFPEEPGWHESKWFRVDTPGFSPTTFDELTVGVQLCTELMFNEHSRYLGRSGAQLIMAPRATGTAVEPWRTAAGMAALTSGAYVFSSNRVGSATSSGPMFGGHGMAYGPGGHPLTETSSDTPMVIVEMDLHVSDAQKLEYPCYVAEI